MEVVGEDEAEGGRCMGITASEANALADFFSPRLGPSRVKRKRKRSNERTNINRPYALRPHPHIVSTPHLPSAPTQNSLHRYPSRNCASVPFDHRFLTIQPAHTLCYLPDISLYSTFFNPILTDRHSPFEYELEEKQI
ncbi:hypothetical protein CROQUDRAFT_96339 [Cronartium quercuum f. sp. fusiforme G11]|uniref:Uncharacterized protein n=1 Tax=Cronartium quercuum f. sp. fusiforme G11 TaxID=708437 RepID=A0A9P6NG52_9BASI|nr:hypothetical protein CROQUDRAFT_96339 [Cronartium quercuum f. sp. fusiforme G11]